MKELRPEQSATLCKVQHLCEGFFFQIESEFWEKYLKRWKRLQKDECIISLQLFAPWAAKLYVHHGAVLGAKQTTWENHRGPCHVSLVVWVYMWTQDWSQHISVNSRREKDHGASNASEQRRNHSEINLRINGGNAQLLFLSAQKSNSVLTWVYGSNHES